MATDISKFSTAYKNIYNLLDRLRNRIIEEGDINYSRWKALGVTTTGSGASRVAKVASAASADKATKDGNGNVIASTYVSKTDASSVFPTTSSNNTFTKTNTFDGTTNFNGATNINGALKITVPLPDPITTDNLYGALRIHAPMTDGTYVQQYPIRFIGCDGVTGDTKQQTLVFGSYTGSTVISSGEGFSSGAQNGKAKILGTGSQEDVYLASDSEIHMWTGFGTNNNTGAGVKALHIAATGDVTLAKTLTVTGAETVNGALTVGGVSTLNGVTTHNADVRALNSSNVETWRINRAGAVTGITSVETSATVKGVKTVDGTKTTTWQLTNGGALSGITNLTLSGALSCKNVDSSSGSTVTRWSLGYTGNASFSGSLTVTGNATLNSALTVKGATTVAALTASGTVQGSGTSPKWSITNAGAASFASTLKVTGASTVAGLTASGTVKGSTDKWSITNAGAITAVSYNSTSDRRLKTNIEERSFSPLLLDKLSPCEYSFKSDPEGVKHVGLIAQDVEAILPEAVREDENGYKSIDYSAVTAMLVGIIKEQDKKIAALTDIVDILVAKAFDGEADV